MAARESGNATKDDNATDQDLFWAAVKEEVVLDFKPSSQTAYTAGSVKVEPVDCDGVSTSDDGQAGIADILLPPIAEVNVDRPPVKREPNQEEPWGHLELDILPQQDPLLLPVDVKQEVKNELPPPGSFLKSSSMKQEPDTAGVDQWRLKSQSYESYILTSIDPLLLPEKQEEGRDLPLCSAAGKGAIVEGQSCPEPFVCDICKEEFGKKSLMRPHISMHGDNSRKSMNLRGHTRIHTGDKPHVCSVCGKRFTSRSNLKCHMFNHTGVKPLECSVCGKRFTFSSFLKKHMLSHTGEKHHACSVCGKRFTHSCHIKQHMLTHTGDKPHACPVCSKRFTRSSTLKVHFLFHTREKSHVCSVCCKRFTLKSNLKQHMISHTGEKPHSCPVSGKRFTYRCNFKSHMFNHTGVKPFECSVCSKRFIRSSTLKDHILTHTGEKSHVCSVCCQRFTLKSNLKRHMLSHTGEKPHACPVCSKRFTQSRTLKLHLLTHTGEKRHAPCVQ